MQDIILKMIALAIDVLLFFGTVFFRLPRQAVCGITYVTY